MEQTVIEKKEEVNEKTNFEWIDEYPTILDIINEYYGTCR